MTAPNGNSEFVPPWMADLGLKAGPDGWLNASKAQLRAMQRPDKDLKVRVWATGILHAPGYNGQEALIVRSKNGQKESLRPGDIIWELFQIAKKYYAGAGIKATDAEWAKLKESKERLREAMSELEDEGVAQRTDAKGTPFDQLSIEQRQRLPSGRTRMFFWLFPRNAKPENVLLEWEQFQKRQTTSSHEAEKPEVTPTALPVPPIWQILKVFQIEKPDKAQISNPDYQKRVERARVAAREVFLEVVLQPLPVYDAEVVPGRPPEVAPTAGAFESKAESRTVGVEQASRPAASPVPLYKRNGPTGGALSEVIEKIPSSVGRSSSGVVEETTDRPKSDVLENPFKPKIREWLESKFKTAIPGFALEEKELDQIAATIHSEQHLKQFQEAAARQKHPRGWKVFVKIARECQQEHATYEKAVAAGAGTDNQDDERMRKIAADVEARKKWR
jgi:hypothetical protein